MEDELDPERVPGAEPRESSADSWTPEGEARELLEHRVRVVPVIGAGISEAANLPGSDALAAALRESFPPHPDGGQFAEASDLREIADAIVNRDRQLEREVQNFVAEFFERQVAETPVHPISQDLLQVPSRLILTLNFDLSVEKAAEEAGINCESWTWDLDAQDFKQLLRQDTAPEAVTVFHLHGSSARPESIVVESRAYSRVANTLSVRDVVSAAFERRMCLVGTSLRDIHFLNELSQVAEPGQLHPLFADPPTADRIAREALIRRVEHGLVVVELPSREHARGVVRFLAHGMPAPEPELPERAKAQAVPEPEGGYVPAVITLAGPEDETDTAPVLAELAYAGSSWGESERVLSEAEVAAGRLSVLLGAPGSGKSATLQALARSMPPGVEPVLIRLRDGGLETAEAGLRLVRWASRGETPAGLEVTAETLEARTFHFLLDGLDELPPALQDQVVGYIEEAAAAFPPHSFTVASRPIEATSAFSEAWRRLRLRPGATWRNRYLERHGVAFDELIAQIEGGGDMRQLLELPFFLSKAVELQRRGELVRGDLWSVVQRLIDNALGAEDARQLLPVTPEAARQWLQDAALAMTLAGRTVLATEEVEFIALPEGVAGDRAEICRALVQRFMLQESGDGYAFVHRIIGEALVAEALAERGPTGELLAAIAPETPEGLAGLAPHWQVPLTLLMLRDETWRAAVREPDPLQWARTVPVSAAVEERREAAELLWRTYTAWRIWMWDRDRPDLIQDAAALARHLRGGGLEAMVEEVRAGLEDDSPRVQGNAIRVLREAEAPGFEANLRRILADEVTEDVTWRQAAVAAAQLGFHDLLDLIVDRAANPAGDELEAQDGTLAALRLAENDEVLEVSRHLLANPRARVYAVHYAGQRLSARQLLTFLRTLAAVDEDLMSSDKELLTEAVGGRDESWGAEEIGEVAFLATVWERADEEILAFLAEDKEAALVGIREALAADDIYWFQARRLLELFSPEELAAAGLDDDLVEMRRRQLAGPSPAAQAAAAQAEAEHKRRLPPTLGEILAFERAAGDPILPYNAPALAGQVNQLSAAERQDLAERVRAWVAEAEGTVAEAITFHEPEAERTSWSIQLWASALLAFGPALNLALEPELWAEVAVCGVLFEPQFKWLRAQATEEEMLLVAENCSSDTARIWSQVLQASADPPAELIEAAAQRVKTFGGDRHELRPLVRELFDLEQVEALRRLAEIEAFRDTVRPYLAQFGDPDSVEVLLAQFEDELANGIRADSDELAWLNGAVDERYLDQLFRCLLLAYRPGVLRSGRAWADPVSPLMNVIRAIGGPQVIERYDHILAGEEGVEFLRLQRDAVVEAELAAAALAAAAEAATSVGLPALPAEP